MGGNPRALPRYSGFCEKIGGMLETLEWVHSSSPKAYFKFYLGQWRPTNVFGFGCNWPTQLHNKFLGIQTNLYDIIQQSKEWSQREGCHKESYHPKLDY